MVKSSLILIMFLSAISLSSLASSTPPSAVPADCDGGGSLLYGTTAIGPLLLLELPMRIDFPSERSSKTAEKNVREANPVLFLTAKDRNLVSTALRAGILLYKYKPIFTRYTFAMWRAETRKLVGNIMRLLAWFCWSPRLELRCTAREKSTAPCSDRKVTTSSD